MRLKNTYTDAFWAAVAAVVFSALPLAFTLVLALSSAAHADDIYWDNSGGSANSWGDVANWSTVVGGGTNPAAIPGSSDVAIFSATPIQGTNQTVELNGNRAVLGLNFLAGLTGSTTLSGVGGPRTLTIGSSGITNAGSGLVAIGSGTGSLAVNVVFSGNQTIANNGSGEIRVNGFTTVTGTLSPTITNSGIGTGNVVFGGNGAIGSTVSGFVQDSATSWLVLRSIGNNTFSGGVEVKKGTVFFGNHASNLGTGTVTLGNGAGGTDAATLRVGDNGNVTIGNPIRLASTTTGSLTLLMVETAVATSHSKTFTGGITGTNSLTIENNGGNDTLNFTTTAINNVGTLTHSGTGAGLTTISSTIGSNVTGLTQNSASTLVLGGTNTYSGPTTVSSGSLRLANRNAVQNSTVTMGGGAGAALTFSSTVSSNAFTLGGLAASAAGAGYNISLLNNAGSPAPIALTVGGNNASTTYAGVLSGSGGSLIKTGTGTLTLTGSSTYTGTTAVNAGSLLVNGGLGNTAVTVNSGALLGGTGSILGRVSVLADGTFSPGTTGGPGLISSGSLGLAGTTLMNIAGTSRGSSYDAANVTGGLTYGGSMTLLLTQQFTTGGTFNLFQYNANEVTGSFAAIFVDPASLSSYTGLTWTNTGTGVWKTGTISGTSMEFRQNVVDGGVSYGQLVIVPEPLTIGLLGIGSGITVVSLRHIRRRKAGGTAGSTADAS